MSNSLSVSAVTATLTWLLEKGTHDNPRNTTVTAKPPDKARGSYTNNQLNVFLYHTTLSASWRNMDMPYQVKSGETAAPPLPLNLYYLLTAYGENDADNHGHLVLGRAMSILHDHSVISPGDIRLSIPDVEESNYDLQHQREGIRITYQPLSLEEMSKLWTTFQTQYRISAAYQVSVILIDSARPAKTPLPVLQQGPVDRLDEARKGPAAQPDLTPPFPTLVDLQPPDPTFGAELGGQVKLIGHHLAGDRTTVLFRHRLLAAPNSLQPLEATGTELEVQLPDNDAETAWPAGDYAVSVLVQKTVVYGELQEQRTNELHLPLAPRIDAIVVNVQGNYVDITPTFKPELRVAAGQRASLLIGDQEVLPQPLVDPPPTTSSLTFRVSRISSGENFLPPGRYYIRLRVDGVDSILVDRGTFKEAHTVTIPKLEG